MVHIYTKASWVKPPVIIKTWLLQTFKKLGFHNNLETFQEQKVLFQNLPEGAISRVSLSNYIPLRIHYC